MFIKQKYNKKPNLKSTFVILALNGELSIFHIMKINFTKILTIIILSSLIGLVYNFMSPSGLSLISRNREIKWASDSLLTSQNHFKDTATIKQLSKQDSANKISPDKKIVEGKEGHQGRIKTVKKENNEDSGFAEPLAINLEQAYKLYQMDVLFIDARENDDYIAGHIKNSLSLPYTEFDKFKTMLSKIPKSQTIISYCGGADCDLSKGLAKHLFELGYHNIYVFFGGWEQWKNAGYPVE
jgi:rhodanese-related sulfurtransferase